MSRFEDWQRPLFDDDGYAHDAFSTKKYGWLCSHPENLELGKGCDIGAFTYIQSEYGVKIGKDVQIGAGCSIYSINTQNDTKGKVIIGDGSFVGAHTIILPGVKIPANSKIKAGSIIK